MSSVTVNFAAADGFSYSASAALPPVAGVTLPLLSPLKLSMLRACLPVGYKITGIDTKVGCVSPPGGMILPASIIPLRTGANAALTTILTTQANTINIGTGVNGQTFANVDFRGWSIVNWGQGVSFINCLFDFNGPATFVIQNQTGVLALTVTGCSFIGSFATPAPNGPGLGAISGNAGVCAISGCLFQDIPSHAIHLAAGSVTGCFFNGLANVSLTHADAISVPCTCGPVTINGNTIDGTNWNVAGWYNYPTGGLGNMNAALYIRTDGGDNVMGVTATNNILLGGAATVDIQQSTIGYLVAPFTGVQGQYGQINNINVTGNYIGFWSSYEFYPLSSSPSPGPNITMTPNTVVDYHNPQWSAAAWSAYPNKANVLYSGVPLAHLYGVTTKPNTFVGGFGGQYINTAAGQPSVFVYLSPGDSQPQQPDVITGFNVATDVIDLSAMGAFTFIGAAAPTGGSQVALSTLGTYTLVSVYMPGSFYPDMQLKLAGNPVLTAANFVL
jgi:hypothetical protein